MLRPAAKPPITLSVGAVVFGMFQIRRLQIRRRAAGESRIARALEAAPVVIAAERDAIDFLARALPHVADPELARLPVETPAPGIAESPGKDFRAVHGPGAVGAAGWIG